MTKPKPYADIIVQDINALIHLIVPGQPIAKARPRLGRFGNTYTPAQTEDAEEHIRRLFLEAGYHPSAEAGCEFALVIHAYFKGKRTSDWDNIGKLCSDALTGMVWKDDRQVSLATVEKFERDLNPRTEIRIWRRG